MNLFPAPYPGAIFGPIVPPSCREAGTVLGSVITFQDVSTLKEIDRMKSDFVAMVAHELKSPLASIEQMIYALQSIANTRRSTPATGSTTG